jgi:ferredoxin
MDKEAYRALARRLDQLPNGFPATQEGIELEILARLFTPQEAILASQLRLTLETPGAIASRLGLDLGETRQLLKSMVRKGLIRAGRTDQGLGFGLLPFVVGIYENQVGRLDHEFARLFERYYLHAFRKMMEVDPPYHRVIPVHETVATGMEVQPHESAVVLLERARAWGVLDCICRKQKALIGEPCGHPIDVCLTFHPKPGVFEGHPYIRPLTKEEALATLARAAQEGLVHTVSNSKDGTAYVCNCCTCSCGILRGMAELGMANVVARSAFVNQVDHERCTGCELCLEACQFEALSVDGTAQVDRGRCVGCGVCVPHCPDGALALVRRPAQEIAPLSETPQEWLQMRAAARGLDIEQTL